MNDWKGLIERGVAALDFAWVANPGEPPRLEARHARPPGDADSHKVMIAASQLHAMLPLIAGSGDRPAAVAAKAVFWEGLAAPSAQARKQFLARYSAALAAALFEYLADEPQQRIEELMRWYKADLKRVDD